MRSEATARSEAAARLIRIVLTITAALGTLGLLVTLAGLVAGVRPLVFQSGSMAPAIPAGSLALSVPVHGGDVAAGDVVSVVSASGVRVTHRVVDLQRSPAGALLTLQGDANPVPDAEAYTVTDVDRVFWSMPGLGYAVSALASPGGVFVLGIATAVLLFHAFRPGRPERRPSRSTVAIAAIPLMAACLAPSSVPTSALFTEASSGAAGSIAAGSIGASHPRATTGTGSSAPCTVNGTWGDDTITFRWYPTSATYPPVADLGYELQFYLRSTPDDDPLPAGLPASTTFRAHAGAASALQSITVRADELETITGLDLRRGQQLQVRIRHSLPGTAWHSNEPDLAVNFDSSGGGFLIRTTDFSCVP